MTARITEKFRIQNATTFRSLFQSNSVYMFLGKETAWVPLSSSSSSSVTPVPPQDTQAEEYANWQDMIAAKRIGFSNTIHVIPRINWSSGVVYTQYDDQEVDLFAKNFYVMTNELNVYKCISNNNGSPSTRKPTGNGTGYITHDPNTSDGYIWKFMYTVQESDAEKFLSQDWIPVRHIGIGEAMCEENNVQYDVQEAAVPGSLSKIQIVSGGSGYGVAPTVTIIGDGSGATATASISGGVVTNIMLTNRGRGYTWAEVVLSSGSASARVILSPTGGHGSNAVKELGGKYVMIRSKIRFDEDNFPQENDYRKIGLVLDPRIKAVAPEVYGEGSIASGTTYDQTVRLRLEPASIIGNGGQFNLDEVITQSGSGATGTVVEQRIDPVSSEIIVKVNNVKGVFDASGNLSAPSGASVSNTDIIEVSGYDLERGTGDILYIDNREPIIRSVDSSEDIRIIVEF